MPKRVTPQEWIDRARKVHKNKYDYTKTCIKNSTLKVVITCPIHGDFKQQWSSHITGNGCNACRHELRKQRGGLANLEIAKKEHPQYDYSRVVYQNAHKLVTIICKKHGPFQIRLGAHFYAKQGCPLCGSGKKRTTSDFVILAKEVHGDRYDYSKSVYKNATTKLKIICKEHGVFSMTPDMHCFSNKQGCPSCRASSGERTIYKILKDRGVTNFICEHSFGDCIAPDTKKPLWFDFYLPEANLLIEYDGQGHFNEINYSGTMNRREMKKRLNRTKYLDNIKNEYANSKNIRLVRIPYWQVEDISLILNSILGIM